MSNFLFILGGVICLMVWPWIYLLHFHSTQTSVLKQYAALFCPAATLLAGYFYYSSLQTDVRSKACGTIVSYQRYMSSGNKNKRQPFERVEILVNHAKYTRHLRIANELQKQPAGANVCFEYYDRKLNPHMTDSILTQWTA
ncbi:hypothetical protein [Acinetobacter sp. YH16037]|nr:hypothetical protein [Acinetobacter sp. YH16037]